MSPTDRTVYRILERPVMTRRLIATLLATLVGAVALIGVAAPAQATDYYRFWLFFTADDGAYTFSATKGVGAVTPEDGTFIAFRWAAPEDFNKPNEPRIDLATVTFDSVCADTPAVEGQKRVGVLVDFGVTEDAGGATIPEATAECAQVPTDATAFQALQKVAELRSKNLGGPFVCAIDGFPASTCGDDITQTASPANAGFVTVASDEPADEADDDSNTPLYVGLGGVVVLLLAGGGFVAARRNKTAA